MTKLQRAYSIFFSLCLAGTLLFLPGQFFLPQIVKENAGGFFYNAGNIYARLPLYRFLENRAAGIPKLADSDTSNLIMEANQKRTQWQGQDAGAKKETDVKPIEPAPSEEDPEIEEPVADLNVFAPDPKSGLTTQKLSDFDYLIDQFYIIDENTATDADQINALRFLGEDLSLEKDPSKPQILIYHSHSQEAFADSREGDPQDTVVGVGEYLAALLTERYGYQVIHVTESFDLFDGVLDRSKAYDAARVYIERVLREHPSIEVVIDLHRDGVPEERRLVTKINGKDTAQILFFNGLSYTASQGEIPYLPNPYIQQNLAFSFQMECLARQYFPDYSRGIYLAGLRYNLHLRPRALLLEAGAQTNTVQEVKNAMEPFAKLLDGVLSGSVTSVRE